MCRRRVQLPQAVETPIQASIRSGWAYHYGYSRSAESREAGDPGQDYLTFEERAECLLFALCDGVSQSYYGDLAAKFVGDRLLDWLAVEGEADAEISGLDRQAHLDQYMRRMTATAGEIVRKHVIPPGIQGMLRDVLLEKRERGSATMYCGGRIDLPRESLPEGRLLLVWQGDIRCRVWSGDVEETSERLGSRFHTTQQWNSVTGPVGGMPHVYESRLLQGGAGGELLLYTDGLGILDSYPRVSAHQLSECSDNEAMRPSSDDISYLQVNWQFKQR